MGPRFKAIVDRLQDQRDPCVGSLNYRDYRDYRSPAVSPSVKADTANLVEYFCSGVFFFFL